MINVKYSQIQSMISHPIDEYADAFKAPNVKDILSKYDINKNALRVCHFLAQVFAETGALSVRIESLNYSATRLMEVWPRRFPTIETASQYAHNEQKLGNFVYGGRLGNVNPGDGFLYRGRGLLQITGRAAYAKYGTQIGISLEPNPDLAFDSQHCLEIAAAEWSASGYRGKTCNALADTDDIVGVTYAINGGQTGIDDRRFWLRRTKSVWMTGATADSDAPIASRAEANFVATDFVPTVSMAVGAEAIGPFGARAASVAIGEWKKFGNQTYDQSGHATHIGHKEGETPWYQYVGDYWRIGVNNDTLTGLDHNVPWSAAFISWVMKTTGAADRFVYSPQHSVYIFRAIQDLLQGKEQAGYWCYHLNEWKPQPGDLVCWAREDGIDYEHQHGGDYAGHCDIVVEVNSSEIQIIGGNVGDSVTKRPLALNSTGFVVPVQQGGETLFGVMRCRI